MMQISTTDADTAALCESGGNAPSPLVLPLRAARGLLLSGLQFPYRIRIDVLGGKLTLVAANLLPRQLSAGSSAHVPVNNRFDLLLLPAIGSAAAGQCQIVLERAGAQAVDSRRLLSREAAKLVFESPTDTWNVAQLAEQLGISVARLRARLFVENTGARCIIKTQRIMHAFALLLTTDLPIDWIATSSGWPNSRALKLALHDGLLADAAKIDRPQSKSEPLTAWLATLFHTCT
jgi:AraC-like DNA-binding protein